MKLVSDKNENLHSKRIIYNCKSIKFLRLSSFNTNMMFSFQSSKVLTIEIINISIFLL